MTSFFRMLLVVTALLTSGALQVAAAMGEDACCAEEEDASGGDCAPGSLCACCPTRGAVQATLPVVAPRAPPGVAVVLAHSEPSVHASASDIFHPPRA